MADRSPSSTYGPFAVSEFFQFLRASPLADIQRRNMQAMAASAAKISDAMTAVASKQMAAVSSLVSMRPREVSSSASGLSDFFASQLHDGREAMEAAITEMRGATDALRNCWYDVASEFEACARDNVNRVQERLKQSDSGEHPAKASAPPAPRTKAAAAE